MKTGACIIISVMICLALPGVLFASDACQSINWQIDEANAILTAKPAQSEAIYRDALGKCGENINLSYNLGLALYAQGKSHEALEVFEGVVLNNPDHLPAVKMIAYILVVEKIDPPKGKSIAEHLLDREPNDRDARSIIMMAFSSRGGEGSTSKSSPSFITGYSGKSSSRGILSELEPPVTGLKNKDAVAVVIGNRDYESMDIPKVKYAHNDANLIKEYLIKVFGYQEENIIFLKNATKAKFEAVFGSKEDHRGKLFNYIKKGKSDILVYYSGHGAPDIKSETGYFVPSDADPSTISLTGYSVMTLYDNIYKISRELQTRQIVIVLDACFSGGSADGMLMKDASPLSVEIKIPTLKLENAIVLTSSSGDEISSWMPEKGHSMFTYFFAKALREEVQSGSKSITSGKLFERITDESSGVPYYARRMYGRVQTPQLFGASDKIIYRK